MSALSSTTPVGQELAVLMIHRSFLDRFLSQHGKVGLLVWIACR